jgi:hypothetical protein
LRGEQLRVEVRDGGGPWAESRHPDELHGRGLVIVSRLARRCGRGGNGRSGWLVWFEMDCPPDCSPEGSPGGSPDWPPGGPSVCSPGGPPGGPAGM